METATEAALPITQKKKERLARKEKKKKPVIEYYLPPADSVGKTTVILGYAMRACLAALLSAAFSNFFCNAFGMIALSRPLVFLISFLLAGIFCLMDRSARWYWIGFGGIVLGLIVLLLLGGNPISFLRDVFPNAWNTLMKTLEEAGFQTLPSLQTTGGLADVTLQQGFQVFLTLSFSVVIFVSVYHRVRLLPIVVCAVFSMLPVLTYNLAYSGTEFAIIVFSAVGIAVLRSYDRALKQQPLGEHKAALGGYMGFGAALLAALAVLIPTATVKSQWQEIKGLSDSMEVARTVLSSVLIGERPDWSSMENGNVDSLGQRTTLATTQSYTGKEILQVYAGVNVPIYLRSWVALNYENDTWRTASEEERQVYENLFGVNFTPEQITQHFFELAAPDLISFSQSYDYRNHMDYGFLTTRVSVSVRNSSGNLLYVPSRLDTESGFLTFVEDENAENLGYGEKTANYFDGIVTTGWLNRNKKYSAVAFLPNYRDPDYAENLEALRSEYLKKYSVIQWFEQQKAENPNRSDEEIAAFMKDTSGQEADIDQLREYLALSETEREQLYQTYLKYQTLAENYHDYVQKHYTKTLGSERLSELANELYLQAAKTLDEDREPNADAADVRHSTVMTVIDYLCDTCTYTLTPKRNTGNIMNRDYDAVESFLFLTHEGYCVQFATSAVFLLREMGIPARYVEGYLANDLEFDSAYTNRFRKYSGIVHDYQAHAWIEVWFEDIGWMTYEVTAPNYDAMYKPYQSSSPILPGPIYTPETELPSDTAPETSEEAEPTETPLLFGFLTEGQAIGVTAFVLGASALAVAVLLLRRRLQKRRHRKALREKRIARALHEEHLNGGEIAELSAQIASLIADTCMAAGLQRDPREYPTEYAARIDAGLAALKRAPILCRRFEQIVPILEKVYFSSGIDREELRMLAEFLVSLRDETRARFNPFELYWYGTVKEMV